MPLWRQTVSLLLVAALLGGCGAQSVRAVRVAGHRPAAEPTVLVLPLVDARTFRDPKDPLGALAAERVRQILLEEMRALPAFERRTIVAPRLPELEHPASLGRALSLAERYGAGLVVAGQLFSFMETRAASIPPRAGLCLRVFSAPEKRLVFFGDEYQSSGAPESLGAREVQARSVCRALLQHYLLEAAAPPHLRVVGPPQPEAPTVLWLPSHDRENPRNLIDDSGGGAVVESIYSLELLDRGVRILRPRNPALDYQRLLTPEEAVALGREHEADFVVRGEVVEFRRAMSVPSWWSVVISTAILAAQVLFAEVSGVDLAHEIYRVEDGACVFARRESSHQKYVVRAEVTVRRLAETTVPAMHRALTRPPEEAVAPVIDAIVIPEEEEAAARELKKALAKERDAAVPPGEAAVPAPAAETRE